jgi:heavy metal efflux system protein
LRKQVTTVFYQIAYLKEKEKILLKTDSIFAEFFQKSKNRFDKGESNILEKTTAEIQLGQIRTQLLELQNDYQSLLIQFNYLLNADTIYTPNYTTYKIGFSETIDSNFVIAQPSVKLIEYEVSINNARIALEKSKKLPELIGGIYWQTFRSSAAFKSNNFGTYGQFGFSFPMFNTSIKHKINAYTFANQIAKTRAEIEKQYLQNQYQLLLNEYKKYNQLVQYYEIEGLKNTSTITTTANNQFTNGNINYLEWTMLINQVTEVQSNYIEAIKQLNNTIIEINSLITKN